MQPAAELYYGDPDAIDGAKFESEMGLPQAFLPLLVFALLLSYKKRCLHHAASTRAIPRYL